LPFSFLQMNLLHLFTQQTKCFKMGRYLWIYVSLLLGCFYAIPTSAQHAKAAYFNPELSIDARVSDLVAKMTLEEKVGQLRYDALAIDRLGVPAYNWWNECLHGVAR